MAGGNASMADWDPNEAPRTRVILADPHVLPEPRCMRAASSQIVILSTSPARPATRPAGSREPWRPLNDRRHQSARSRNSRQSRLTGPLSSENEARRTSRTLTRPVGKVAAEEIEANAVSERTGGDVDGQLPLGAELQIQWQAHKQRLHRVLQMGPGDPLPRADQRMPGILAHIREVHGVDPVRNPGPRSPGIASAHPRWPGPA